MTTEDILRFHPAPGQGHMGKPNEHTWLLSNSLGYQVRRTLVPRWQVRGGHRGQPQEAWDAFAPDGRFIGMEPSRYWAMKLADAHFVGGSR